jgi:hypothetical protein
LSDPVGRRVGSRHSDRTRVEPPGNAVDRARGATAQAGRGEPPAVQVAAKVIGRRLPNSRDFLLTHLPPNVPHEGKPSGQTVDANSLILASAVPLCYPAPSFGFDALSAGWRTKSFEARQLRLLTILRETTRGGAGRRSTRISRMSSVWRVRANQPRGRTAAHTEALASGESGGMADASRLGRDGVTRGGSTPPSRTRPIIPCSPHVRTHESHS